MLENALFSIMVAMEGDKLLSEIKTGTRQFPDAILWRSTIGAMYSKSFTAGSWGDDKTGKKYEAWLDAISAFVGDIDNRGKAFKGPGGEPLTAVEVDTLFQVVEVLMFLEELK